MNNWNMPPGVTTNDIPGNCADDGGDQEAAYCDWIAATMTAEPAEFIVDTWLDGFKLVDDRAAKTAAERLIHLRQVMLFAMRSICTELEMAENAARMGGDVGFSEWVEGR